MPPIFSCSSFFLIEIKSQKYFLLLFGKHLVILNPLSFRAVNPSAWGHLNPSSYCDVGRLFYGVFKLWSKLQRKKMKK
jgi:hypothetical protein